MDPQVWISRLRALPLTATQWTIIAVAVLLAVALLLVWLLVRRSRKKARRRRERTAAALTATPPDVPPPGGAGRPRTTAEAVAARAQERAQQSPPTEPILPAPSPPPGPVAPPAGSVAHQPDPSDRLDPATDDTQPVWAAYRHPDEPADPRSAGVAVLDDLDPARPEPAPGPSGGYADEYEASGPGPAGGYEPTTGRDQGYDPEPATGREQDYDPERQTGYEGAVGDGRGDGAESGGAHAAPEHFVPGAGGAPAVAEPATAITPAETAVALPDTARAADTAKDRLLRVLLADPDRALHAVGDLESSRGELTDLHESVAQHRKALADAARRLRGAGLTPTQVAELAGVGESELAGLLAEHAPSPRPRIAGPAPRTPSPRPRDSSLSSPTGEPLGGTPAEAPAIPPIAATGPEPL